MLLCQNFKVRLPCAQATVLSPAKAYSIAMMIRSRCGDGSTETERMAWDGLSVSVVGRSSFIQ